MPIVGFGVVPVAITRGVAEPDLPMTCIELSFRGADHIIQIYVSGVVDTAELVATIDGARTR